VRILLVSDVYFPRVNGVSTSIQTFAHQFLALGHDVRLIAPSYATEAEERFPIQRIPARPVPFDPEDHLMQRAHMRRVYPEIARLKPDLVHVQTPFAAHYEGVRLARRLRVPLIETYHTYFEEYLENYLPWVPRKLLRLAARRFTVSQCHSVDAVVVPSTPMLNVLRRYGVSADCHVIPTGIPSVSFASGDGAAFRARHAIPPDRPLMLYVGRVAYEKNVQFLIDVVDATRRSLPNILLVIAGEGPARGALERDVSRRGLLQHVLFSGYLGRDRELPDCYAAADVFVFASRTETQGLVLLEAMAAGTPVVTTAVMGTEAVMADGAGGLVVAEDAPRFADALSRLLGDSELSSRLSREARRKAAEWSDRALAEKMLGLYADLIRQSADGARACPASAGGNL
jgi:glycosyltransferase involved in cell wall biosynthesis